MAGEDDKLISRRTILKVLDLDGQVLDQLEELEIVVPIQRPGRERAYALDDVDRLRVYAVLVHELEVNPAGAEIILRMRGRLLDVRSRLLQLFSQARARGMLEELQALLDSLDQDL